MAQELNGRAMVFVSAGILFVWSGIKGWSVLGTINDVIKGQKPDQENIQPLGTSVNPIEPGNYFPITQGGIAAAALQYQGHAYRFGGAPGTDGSKPWDCSSFVNWIVSTKLGLSIPGYKAGAYKGTVHGPATGQWAVWPGLRSVSRSDVAVNDIIVWAGHMGIAISNSQYVSALNPKAGTAIRPIDGEHSSKLVRYGRYVGV